MSLLCDSVWGDSSEQGQYHCLASRVLFGGISPMALTIMPNTSISPHMPSVPFQQMPWCRSSEGMSLYKSLVHSGSFKRRLLRSCSFFHYPNAIVFCTQKLWRLNTLSLEPWFGWPGVWLRSLAPEVLLPFLSTTHGHGTTCFMPPCVCSSMNLSTPLCISVPLHLSLLHHPS